MQKLLRPMLDELKELWLTGLEVTTKNHETPLRIKAALLLVSCDLPAARKVMGFTGVRQGCSRCTKSFPRYRENGVNKWDCSGYDEYKTWPRRCRTMHVKYSKK